MSRLHVWTRLESVSLLTNGVFQSSAGHSQSEYLAREPIVFIASVNATEVERDHLHVEFNQFSQLPVRFSQLPVRTDHFWSRSVAMYERDWKDLASSWSRLAHHLDTTTYVWTRPKLEKVTRLIKLLYTIWYTQKYQIGSKIPGNKRWLIHRYFLQFEKIAECLKWPEGLGALLLQSVFIGKAREIYPSLSIDKCMVVNNFITMESWSNQC